MDFSLTDDQEALRSSVRDFLEKESPIAEVRRIFESEDGLDGGLWEKVSGLGWTGLLVPEEFGGAGLGWVEAAIVAEEMGRFLFCGPYLSTILSTAAIAEAAVDEHRKAYLPKLAEGSLICAPALFEGRRVDAGPVHTTARRHDGGYVLTGSKDYVCDAVSAGLFLVAALDEEEASPRIFLVDAGAEGLVVEPSDVVDRTRRQGVVRLDGAEAVGKLDAGAFDLLVERAALFCAGEQTGIARKCLEMAVEYAGSRHQFGKPIGVYQAVSHKISDMFLGAEHAASLLYYAAWAADHEQGQAAPAAWEAMVWASQAARRAALDAIQVHGGIGFTWEHDLHLYLKRAKANQALFGEEPMLLDRIAEARHPA